jgi:hypothetical protein
MVGSSSCGITQSHPISCYPNANKAQLRYPNVKKAQLRRSLCGVAHQTPSFVHATTASRLAGARRDALFALFALRSLCQTAAAKLMWGVSGWRELNTPVVIGKQSYRGDTPEFI